MIFLMKRKKPQGFIIIVGLMIIALMMVVTISLQMTVMDTYGSIKSSDNYMTARITADSIMELVQYKLKGYEVGLNSGEIVCGYGKFAPQEGNPGFCNNAQLNFLTTPDPGKAQKDIRITISVKGRNNDDEKIKTGKCGNVGNNNCYVVPSPGTGDAGDEQYCKIYKPDFTNTPAASNNIESNLDNVDLVDQLDYGCNWNRLRFGSTMTDRVAIPLYYDEAKLGEDSGIVDVFNENTPADFKAENILVRLRTPCVPCGMEMDNGALRECDDTIKDDTVCKDNERYVLDDGDLGMKDKKNDIVVQWLLNGECGEGGGGNKGFCGMIPIGDKTKKETVISAFYESKINEAKNMWNYIVINNSTRTYDTNTYPKTVSLLITDNEENFPIKLTSMFKPVLTLFLSKPLLTDYKWRIPYLEYQILTDKPISNNESVLEVEVVVGTNGFTRTLTKEVPKPLIDFAIKN